MKLMQRLARSKSLLLAWAFVCATFFAEGASAQKVNLNNASREELQELPGVGPKLADAIVTDRDDNGPFTSVEDLARVPGVSAGLVQKLFDEVHVGAKKKIGGIILKEGDTIDASVVKKVLQQYQGEPSIREVQKAAISYANAHPDIVSSMQSRVRASAALPQFRVRAGGDVGQGVDEKLDGDGSNSRTNKFDYGGAGYVQGTWQLDRLLFHKDELGIARETVRLSNLRSRVVNEVTRRFFERRRLQVELDLNPSTDLTDRIRKELRIQEITADIDALTGGWFSTSLERLGREPY